MNQNGLSVIGCANLMSDCKYLIIAIITESLNQVMILEGYEKLPETTNTPPKPCG